MPSARASSSLKRRAERGLYVEVQKRRLSCVHQSSSEVIRVHQSSSAVIRVHQKRRLSCGSWYETPYPSGWTGPKPERTRVVGAVSVLVESSLPLTCEEGIAPW